MLVYQRVDGRSQTSGKATWRLPKNRTAPHRRQERVEPLTSNTAHGIQIQKFNEVQWNSMVSIKNHKDLFMPWHFVKRRAWHLVRTSDGTFVSLDGSVISNHEIQWE